MRIPECIVQAAEWGAGENFNHVIVKCEENEKEAIRKLFEKEFTKIVIREMTELVDECGDCVGLYSDPEEKVVSAYEEEMTIGLEIMELEGYFWGFDPTELESYDIAIHENEDGLFITYPILVYMGGMGDCFIDRSEAIQGTLRQIVNQYPNCSYSGYEAYMWTDIGSGEVEQQGISSEADKQVFEFVSKKLNTTIEDYDFWDIVEEVHADMELVDEIGEFMEQVSTDVESKTYDFIGEKIGCIMKEERFWEMFEEMDFDNEAEEILQFIDQYKEYVSKDALKKIEEMLG